jgi:hypothetical protein
MIFCTTSGLRALPSKIKMKMKDNLAFSGASSLDRNLRKVMKECDEVVLFGSRSSMVHRSNSDWDILCIARKPPAIWSRGLGHRLRVNLGGTRLDLIWISTDVLRATTWLGSELASHIATYGSWLTGSGDWRTKTAVSDRALAAKRRRVEVRVEFQRQYGSSLLRPYLTKHLTLLRRDIQRLYCLENKIAIPTTPHLDGQWRSSRDRAPILRLLHSFGDFDGASLLEEPSVLD